MHQRTVAWGKSRWQNIGSYNVPARVIYLVLIKHASSAIDLHVTMDEIRLSGVADARSGIYRGGCD
uniref:AlNc14C159G7723 protein n=1 Tax=Albugo laibachii Nc14 TaxID=890382 RepID=F0WMN5_9STRA|nr:AlNc14C159G7723 [Albugo laibachii Nc14]|eukprot:CCA22569.1 AlNc14C159G7723 [Albugo laibachii Nc14]